MQHKHNGLQAYPHLGRALWMIVLCCVLFVLPRPAAHAEGDGSELNPSSAEAAVFKAALAHVNELNGTLNALVDFPVEVVSAHRRDWSPFLAIVSKSKPGTCLLVVNTNPLSWRMWAQFVSASGMRGDHSFRFAALHELGHCVNRMRAPSGLQPIPPGPDSELNADLFAIETTQQLYGIEAAQTLAAQVIKGRKSQEWIAPTHAIVDRLKTELNQRGLVLASLSNNQLGIQ